MQRTIREMRGGRAMMGNSLTHGLSGIPVSLPPSPTLTPQHPSPAPNAEVS